MTLPFSPDLALLFLGLLYEVLTHTSQSNYLSSQANRKVIVTEYFLCQVLTLATATATVMGGVPGSSAPSDSATPPPQCAQTEFPGEEEASGMGEWGNFLTSLDVPAFTPKILSHD